MTRPAKVSSSNIEEVRNGKSASHSRPIATEARPNPIILEDDNEGSTSRETTGECITIIQLEALELVRRLLLFLCLFYA